MGAFRQPAHLVDTQRGQVRLTGHAMLDKLTYHLNRVRAVLDAAYRAAREESAAIPLRLCILHMERSRSFGQDESPRPVSA